MFAGKLSAFFHANTFPKMQMLSSGDIGFADISLVAIRHVWTSLQIRYESREEAQRVCDMVVRHARRYRRNRSVWIEGWFDSMKIAITYFKSELQACLGPLTTPAILTIGSINAYNGERVYVGQVKFVERAVGTIDASKKSTPFKPPILTDSNDHQTKVVYEMEDEVVYHKLAPKGELRNVFTNALRHNYGLITNGLLRSSGIGIDALSDETKEIILQYGCTIFQSTRILPKQFTNELFYNFGDMYGLSEEELLCVKEAASYNDNCRDA